MFYHATAHALCTIHHAVVLTGAGKGWGNRMGKEREGGGILKGLEGRIGRNGVKGVMFGAIGGNVIMGTKRAWAI